MSQSEKNITKELDEKFYQKTLRPDRQQSYKLIAKFIKRMTWPDVNNVVDYGCGAGWILHWLKYYGVENLTGVEPNKNARSFMDDDVKDCVKFRTLKRKIKLEQTFDMAICLEVAEHLDEKYADLLVENITNDTELLIFSAAPPGQGGWGHVNEQPFEYWEERLNASGFFVDGLKTAQFKTYLTAKNAKRWYCNNIAVFGESLG